MSPTGGGYYPPAGEALRPGHCHRPRRCDRGRRVVQDGGSAWLRGVELRGFAVSSFVFGFIRLDRRRLSLQLPARSAIGGSHRKVKCGHEPSLYSKTRNQVCHREAAVSSRSRRHREASPGGECLMLRRVRIKNYKSLSAWPGFSVTFRKTRSHAPAWECRLRRSALSQGQGKGRTQGVTP
jgi:hypothetical protein